MQIACSRRSDSRVREKYSRRNKKKDGRLEREVFPVYKLTNSLPTYHRALLSERLEQPKMQMTTIRSFSHYIFTFRKKSHVSGARGGRDRYKKGAARTRGGEGFLQGGCDFVLSLAPRYFASLLATLLP